MGVRRFYTTRLAPTRLFTGLHSKILTRIDRAAARLTGGRRTVTGTVYPTLLLTHRGRVSGRVFTTPLMYVEHAGGWAVAGTNFGRPDHPAWTANLLATPETDVLIDGVTTLVRARPVTDEERAELWPRLAQMYAGYEVYAERSGRTPRMFVLEPRLKH
jgi:deazaflavin-dependent oxidoreductase (nitroreductase family)